MRWVMRFFAVYILSLSLFPCGDKDDCTLTAKQQQTITTAHHTSQDEHAENCPPLCTCACCGIHFLHFSSSIKINKPYFFSSPTLSKQDFNLTEIHLPIWQPPQLS